MLNKIEDHLEAALNGMREAHRLAESYMRQTSDPRTRGAIKQMLYAMRDARVTLERGFSFVDVARKVEG